MPHYPKPFFREERGRWYVQLNGMQHNLGRDWDDAFRRYHELMQCPSFLAFDDVRGSMSVANRSVGTSQSVAKDSRPDQTVV